jgi:hypothetical protein
MDMACHVERRNCMNGALPLVKWITWGIESSGIFQSHMRPWQYRTQKAGRGTVPTPCSWWSLWELDCCLLEEWKRGNGWPLVCTVLSGGGLN